MRLLRSFGRNGSNRHEKYDRLGVNQPPRSKVTINLVTVVGWEEHGPGRPASIVQTERVPWCLQ
ncbi:hypothetical protein PISMIDRAFT_212527 [Pisolithus microcarpus 441]|uniref:Uncharacterized protein n=1 Tax=Pisolithus microcarpus 441 TaxID=765257 RepID=A0A0C9YUF6_9AGAM|nr:hypothetical protein PISMIDRAFT_212527 [Pisolithus microcarpus 441]